MSKDEDIFGTDVPTIADGRVVHEIDADYASGEATVPRDICSECGGPTVISSATRPNEDALRATMVGRCAREASGRWWYCGQVARYVRVFR